MSLCWQATKTKGSEYCVSCESLSTAWIVATRDDEPVCMPTKQFHELNATASIRPEVKKQVMMTPPIHAISNSSLVYLDIVLILSLLSIASMSTCLGDGVGLLEDTFFRSGLGFREPLGVLLRVGAAELNFSRSMFDPVLSISALSTSTNVTARLGRCGGADEEDIFELRQERSNSE